MLKLKIVCSIVTLALCFIYSNHARVLAHPGNTAADGGHYCWTRCDYWGEVYGERHFHGGSGTAQPEYTEPDPPEYEPPDEPDYEPSDAPEPSSSSSSTSTTPASSSSSDNKSCYIATASYGNKEYEDVRYLRSYRDEILVKNMFGKILVHEYYRYSPFAASVIQGNEPLKLIVRETQIKPLVNIVRLTRK